MTKKTAMDKPKSQNTTSEFNAEFNAWNPGLNSTIPHHLNNQITLFHPDHSWVSFKDAQEAASLTGLPISRLVDLKLERMAVHELLVRVTAELSVPDGPSYEFLGLQLRGMVKQIHDKYVLPQIDDLNQRYDEFRDQAKSALLTIIKGQDQAEAPEDVKSKSKPWWNIFGRSKPPKASKKPSQDQDELGRINAWLRASKSAHDSRKAALYAALAELGQAILGQRGRLVFDDDVMAGLALRLFCQDYGSLEIRRMIEPIFYQAVREEGYRLLPSQEKRIVMNTKGASAAGKSTIRPHQRKLAEKMGIPWEDFALISPDYWRKYLLDYDSLGDDYKYAAMLTGMELEMIDLKLDHLMAEKAAQNKVPHMLIDRFRFDSFMVSNDGEYESRLLTRFGDTVYLFFVITPPAETVERAWQRGLSTQRYKAVDDLLYHNIEAYKGMPELFFSWAGVRDKRVHFEFLDNDVPLGEDPRTIAFGVNDRMTILDPETLDRIDQFRYVNIHATSPGDVLEDQGDNSHGFIRQCISMMASIDWMDSKGEVIWGKIEHGQWISLDEKAVPSSVQADQSMLNAMGYGKAKNLSHPEPSADLDDERRYTIGRWAARQT